MKTVTADELNRMPAGTVFCQIDKNNHPAGMPEQILSTFMSDGESHIDRTDDGVIWTKEIYERTFMRPSEAIQRPLAICWGSRSVGCWNGDDKYLVLDYEDVKTLCRKILSKANVNLVGDTELKIISDLQPERLDPMVDEVAILKSDLHKFVDMAVDEGGYVKCSTALLAALQNADTSIEWIASYEPTRNESWRNAYKPQLKQGHK